MKVFKNCTVIVNSVKLAQNSITDFACIGFSHTELTSIDILANHLLANPVLS